MKVTPKTDHEYATGQFLIPYFELYNAVISQTTNKPDLQIIFSIKSGARIVSTVEDSDGRNCFSSAEGVIVVEALPLKNLDPGKYSLEVKVLDRATGQTLVTGADFTIKR